MPTPVSLDAVLDGAARLQELVPGAVLVGGSAAAYHAGHRLSVDHDHVVEDLASRFDTVLETPEALDDWSTARLVAGKVILGELGGIETGVRQMVRQRPLEVEEVAIGQRVLRVPTLDEILRIKAWLVVSRNQTRDYLDAAALADRIGIGRAGRLLARMDDYYAEVNRRPEAVATQVARQFADPSPRDSSATKRLSSYRRLDAHWHDWRTVVETLRAVAVSMTDTAMTDTVDGETER